MIHNSHDECSITVSARNIEQGHEFPHNCRSVKGIVATFMVLVLLLGPKAVQAQYIYTTNANNTITITGYTGAAGL